MSMLALASDFVGITLKKVIMDYFDQKGIAYKDYGTYDTEVCDYPIYALKAANAVASGECERGIVFCGTGVGISIAANKVKGIRCACCSEPYSAKMSTEHNNANMLALGTRVLGGEYAKMIVDAWLEAKFLGQQHQKRIDMISMIERDGTIGCTTP